KTWRWKRSPPMPSAPLRRDQLIEAIAAEMKRLRRASQETVRATLESQIAALAQEVKRIESAIEEAVPKDETAQTNGGDPGEHPRGGEADGQPDGDRPAGAGSPRRQADRIAGRCGAAFRRE